MTILVNSTHSRSDTVTQFHIWIGWSHLSLSFATIQDIVPTFSSHLMICLSSMSVLRYHQNILIVLLISKYRESDQRVTDCAWWLVSDELESIKDTHAFSYSTFSITTFSETYLILLRPSSMGEPSDPLSIFRQNFSTTDFRLFLTFFRMIHPQVHLRIPCYDFFIL